MAAPRITLYHSPASRAFTAYWMLEELGVPFKVETIDIRKGEQKSPDYLKLNPSGKVPTITDGTKPTVPTMEDTGPINTGSAAVASVQELKVTSPVPRILAPVLTFMDAVACAST